MNAIDSVRLNVRVQPKASRNALVLEPDGRIRVALTAPPVDGEANKALIAFLASRLHVPKRDVSLVHGAASREKVIGVKGLTKGDVEDRLRPGSGRGCARAHDE